MPLLVGQNNYTTLQSQINVRHSRPSCQSWRLDLGSRPIRAREQELPERAQLSRPSLQLEHHTSQRRPRREVRESFEVRRHLTHAQTSAQQGKERRHDW